MIILIYFVVIAAVLAFPIYFSIVRVKSVPFLKVDSKCWDDGSMRYARAGTSIRIPRRQIGSSRLKGYYEGLRVQYGIYLFDDSSQKNNWGIDKTRIFLLMIPNQALTVRSPQYENLTYDFPIFACVKGSLRFYESNVPIPVGTKIAATVFREYSRAEIDFFKRYLKNQVW